MNLDGRMDQDLDTQNLDIHRPRQRLDSLGTSTSAMALAKAGLYVAPSCQANLPKQVSAALHLERVRLVPRALALPEGMLQDRLLARH